MQSASPDLEFCPTLSEHGQHMLDFMREHPAAPTYRNQTGNRLLANEVDQLRQFERDIRDASISWTRNTPPLWLDEFIKQTYQDVPYYRRQGTAPRRLEDIRSVCRADLSADIARFVPDSVAADRLINFRTTGTTGNPLLVPSHPLVAGSYLAFHKRALRRFDIELQHGRNQVGVVLLGMQKKCFTYVSVTPVMNDSGLAKINLHPDDWRIPEDRASYLDALNPEVIAGDPISFTELLTLELNCKPRALFSVGMMLLPGLRQLLEERFSCPVLDLYSLNEVGPVGVFDALAGGHVLLQPKLYVEILDPVGNQVAPGERGEITFTGGFNFCLPLLRYRSGDFASLAWHGDEPVLRELSGRKPVRFKTRHGAWINNIDVTHALAALPLQQFGLHQQKNGSLVLHLPRADKSFSDSAISLIQGLLGNHDVSVAEITSDDKILQYTSDMEQPSA